MFKIVIKPVFLAFISEYKCPNRYIISIRTFIAFICKELIMVQAYDKYQYVENLFKTFIKNGLILCDLPTGSGKSRSFCKLSCNYYFNYYDRIIIFCVQKKLVDSLYQDLLEFSTLKDSLIKQQDIVVVHNNTTMLKQALDNQSLADFMCELKDHLLALKANKAKVNLKPIATEKLLKRYRKLQESFDDLRTFIKKYDINDQNIKKLFDDKQNNFKKQLKDFFKEYATYFKLTTSHNLDLKYVKKITPSLFKAMPHIAINNKKIILMTIHKAMYGIDTILSDVINIQNIACDDKQKTLIFFDESDMAYIAMRDAIIDKACASNSGDKLRAKGYYELLDYMRLTDNSKSITDASYEHDLLQCLKNIVKYVNNRWYKLLNDHIRFTNILPENLNMILDYRNGVFFSGPLFYINIKLRHDQYNSYICRNLNTKGYILCHSKDASTLKYDMVIPMHKFLKTCDQCVFYIKLQLSKIILSHYKQRKKEYENNYLNLTDKTNNSFITTYPTLENEVHTLLARFGTNLADSFEYQLIDFINHTVSKQYKNRSKEYNVYSQGFRFYQEQLDERDNEFSIKLSMRELNSTAEQLILDLLKNKSNTVVLCSATASSRSVISNFNINYLKEQVSDRFYKINKEQAQELNKLMLDSYPKEHQIKVQKIEHYQYNDKRAENCTLPDKYRNFFCKEACDNGLVTSWFIHTKNSLLQDKDDISFDLYRTLQFIEVYHFFIAHDGIHSMIYFQNNNVNVTQANIISSLIDGYYKNYIKEDSKDSTKENLNNPLKYGLPHNWTNPHLKITNNLDELNNTTLKEFGSNKDAKIMLICPYASFKAGANLQYKVPPKLKILHSKYSTKGNVYKDWDAIFLQCPRSYLTINKDNYEKDLYKIMLSLMIFYHEGLLSYADIKNLLNTALNNNFYFSEKTYSAIYTDKAAFVQTIIEQAIGRICRTNNKVPNTYILYDEDIVQYIDNDFSNKAVTVEFAEFIKNVLREKRSYTNSNNITRKAKTALIILSNIRNQALRHINISSNIAYDEQAQYKLQELKHEFIKRPVIKDSSELTEFYAFFYAPWMRNQYNEITFFTDSNHSYYSDKPIDNKSSAHAVSSALVRLDILVSNSIIREHFEKNGFATTWDVGDLCLHPFILQYEYAGEIGEEAFKAILLACTDCKADDIKHLTKEHYELADFIVYSANRSKKIAFDVKNLDPDRSYIDNPKDIPTLIKRKDKEQKLGCNLITVNIVKISASALNNSHEIFGLIYKDGSLVIEAIEQLRYLIKGLNKDE